MGIIQNFRLISSTAKTYFANKLDTQKHTYFQIKWINPIFHLNFLQEMILRLIQKITTIVHENVERPDLEKGTFTYAKLEKFPGVTNCTNCNLEVTTNVDKKLSGGGWTWAILCCCFGSWILSILVMCMDVFWKFIHYCPRCSKKLAEYRPKWRCKTKFNLIMWSIIIVGLQCFILFGYLLPLWLTGYPRWFS